VTNIGLSVLTLSGTALADIEVKNFPLEMVLSPVLLFQTIFLCIQEPLLQVAPHCRCKFILHFMVYPDNISSCNSIGETAFLILKLSGTNSNLDLVTFNSDYWSL